MVKPWTPNLLQFHLNKLFVLTMVSNLTLFCLATYLATFQKNGQFLLNQLVTLFVLEILWDRWLKTDAKKSRQVQIKPGFLLPKYDARLLDCCLIRLNVDMCKNFINRHFKCVPVMNSPP